MYELVARWGCFSALGAIAYKGVCAVVWARCIDAFSTDSFPWIKQQGSKDTAFRRQEKKKKKEKKIRHNLLNSHNLTINNFYVNQNLIIVTEIWIEKIKA